MRVQALYGEANVLYWKSFERRNSTHLTLLKHQNTKTVLYKLPKNHWVIPLFENFGPVRNKLLVTVSLDNPVTGLIKRDQQQYYRRSYYCDKFLTAGWQGLKAFRKIAPKKCKKRDKSRFRDKIAYVQRKYFRCFQKFEFFGICHQPDYCHLA